MASDPKVFQRATETALFSKLLFRTSSGIRSADVPPLLQSTTYTMDAFWAAPPISRTLAAVSVVLSGLLHGQILPFRWFIFWRPWLLKPLPELWRLITPFFITGSGLGIILEPYLLYNYGSSLETQSPRFSNPADLITYIVFISLVIVATAGIGLDAMIFTQALIAAFGYTFAQENPNAQMSYIIVTLQAKYLPCAMLLLSLVRGGPVAAMHQATGLFAAHLYDFLTRIWPTFGGGRNLIVTPAIVKGLFERGVRTPGASAGAARPSGQQQSEGSRGWTSGFGGPSNWGSRGSGRRLGGD